MARPIKKGLDYFPQDTDIYSDRKIRRLMRAFGANGFVVYTYIKAQCFRENGYWIQCDAHLCFDIMDALQIGITEKQVMEIISMCIKLGLFDEGVFNNMGILTSADMQATYLAAKKSTRIIDEIWVIPNETPVIACIPPINAAETPKNEPLSTQRKVKERKGNKRKENERKEKESNFFNVDDVKENYTGIENFKNVNISDERLRSLTYDASGREKPANHRINAHNHLLTLCRIPHKPTAYHQSHLARRLVGATAHKMYPHGYPRIRESGIGICKVRGGDVVYEELGISG